MQKFDRLKAQLATTQGRGRAALASLTVLGIAVLGVHFLSPSQAASTNPLAGATFYIDQGLSPVVEYNKLKSSNPTQAAQIAKIATWPIAIWLGGWVTNTQSHVQTRTADAAAKGQLPIFVMYNIPSRDCGQYSAGGEASHAGYRAWVDSVAAGIGQRKAVVIVEPDALGLFDCLDAAGRTARMESIKYAVNKLKSTTQAYVYIEASTWVSPTDMATRLQTSGIANADGFAMNVSAFNTTDYNINYGTELSGKVGGKHFVIDTSRNGLGPTPDAQWCNPPGRALGTSPTTNTASPLADAYLWLKVIGESDGTCNGGPSAGTWWLEYALGLAERSSVKPNTSTGVTPTPTPPAPTPPAPTPTPTPPPVTVGLGSHNDTVFTYTGAWTKGDNTVAGGNKYQADDYYGSTAGATYALTFTGTQAKVYATKAPQHGIAAIRIDNGAEVMVDLYAAARADQQLVFTSPTLTSGTHTVRVRVTGTKNAAATEAVVNADRIDIANAMQGDVNGDGRINALDLSVLLVRDGQNYPAADFNSDGMVGAADMAVILSRWTW